jgi:ABC-type microcin C transport system duplicated ATPase subunit YejF
LTTGSIRLHGEQIAGNDGQRLRVSKGKIQLVFQEPAESLDPRLRIGSSVEEAFIPLWTKSRERRHRVIGAIKRVGFSQEMLNLYPAELSAAQQQRVGIARAIVAKAELIVLNEPTSALDTTARAEIIELLKSIQQEPGTSYFFISHDLSTVRSISHRVQSCTLE